MEVQRSALTPLVGELVATGVVYEKGTVASARSRRPILLRVRVGEQLAEYRVLGAVAVVVAPTFAATVVG